jgi:uncharacterized protein (TIGR02246 family)
MNTVRKAIEGHNANLERWYRSGDIDSVASLFTEDAWQMPPHSPPLVGREAIRRFWREAVTWGTWDFTLEVQEVAMRRSNQTLEPTAGGRDVQI